MIVKTLDGRYVDVRTVPLRCRLFGHAWHNDQGWSTTIPFNEPCERRGCPATRSRWTVEQVDALDVTAPVEADQTVADLIHAHRFARDSHDSLPNTFYAGMRYAEKLARGESPTTASIL